jgi:hypothetical protein
LTEEEPPVGLKTSSLEAGALLPVPTPTLPALVLWMLLLASA